MAQNVLYLIRTATPDPLLGPRSGQGDSTVVLLEDGVTRRDVTAPRVYVLAEHAAARNVAPAFPSISYPELLDLVFRADRVVTL